MSERQSRFSIVDELITKKTETQNKIRDEQRRVTDIENDNKIWERNVELDREARQLKLEQMKVEATANVETLKEQLEEYQKGLDAIQQISKEKDE